VVGENSSVFRGAASSRDNCLLPEEGFGFYTPAIDTVELVDNKVAASWMLHDITASFIGLRHLGQVSFIKRSKDRVSLL